MNWWGKLSIYEVNISVLRITMTFKLIAMTMQVRDGTNAKHVDQTVRVSKHIFVQQKYEVTVHDTCLQIWFCTVRSFHSWLISFSYHITRQPPAVKKNKIETLKVKVSVGRGDAVVRWWSLDMLLLSQGTLKDVYRASLHPGLQIQGTFLAPTAGSAPLTAITSTLSWTPDTGMSYHHDYS